MIWKKKLELWQKNGLIDQPTVGRILQFEEKNTKSIGFQAVVALGGFAIGVGIISIVAANWSALSDWLKLLVCLALNIAFGLSVYFSKTKWKAPTAGDVFQIIQFLFVLASIALIGQVFQLSSQPYRGLVFWVGLGLPIMALTGGIWPVAVWILAAITASVTYIFNASDWFETQGMAPVPYLVPFFIFTLGAIASDRKLLNANLCTGLKRLNLFWWLGITTLSSFLWQISFYHRNQNNQPAGILICLVLLLPALLRPDALFDQKHSDPGGVLAARVWLLAGFLAFIIPFHTKIGRSELLATLLFIFLWGIFARASLKFRSIRMFNFATAVIALRVVVAYFELFGTLMNTGIAMISGGLLTLAVAWIWTKLVRQKSPSSRGLV